MMKLVTAANASILLVALLLCLQGSTLSSALRLGVYHSAKENAGQGWHDLKAVAEALNRTGHQVGILSKPAHHPNMMCAKTLRTTQAAQQAEVLECVRQCTAR